MALSSPFTAEVQLNEQLQLDGTGILRRVESKGSDDEGDIGLPGQPRVQLGNEKMLLSYLHDNHSTKDLDKCGFTLWVVAPPNSANIPALHYNLAVGRTLRVSENPSLHLLVTSDVAFLKPIPRYLLATAFWSYLATRDRNLYASCLGFLRTYNHLIRYERDFKLAQTEDLDLIPKEDGEGKRITFAKFTRLIEQIGAASDDQVAFRWRSGVIQYSEWREVAPPAVTMLVTKHVGSKSFLERTWPVYVGVFAIWSVLLSAFQVALAVPGASVSAANSRAFVKTAFWLAITTAVIIACLMAGVLISFSIAQAFVVWRMEKQLIEKINRKSEKQLHSESGASPSSAA